MSRFKLGFFLCSLLQLSCAISPVNFNDGLSTLIDSPYRLKNIVYPIQYEVEIKNIDFTINDGIFDAETKIIFQTSVADLKRVKMHSKNLERLTILNKSNDLGNVTISYDTDYDFIIFDMENPMVIGDEYFIHVQYQGNMPNDMTGFYKSYYREGNQIKFLGTTQMQPVHARKVFPCFDEPSYKAIFIIKINCPTGFNCISNMPEKSRSESNLIEFLPTPKMSTYLVAFIVSEFISAKESPETEADKFRIIARPDARNMGEYAFNFSKSIVKTMEDYMEIEYFKMHPKIKMDQVAIPDFSAGAMENWGIITYREPFVMYHPEESSTRYRQQVARLLTHEIVHMWFGNLATCHWWSDTWLNEGFANFFQHYALKKVENFGMDDQFIISQLHSSLQIDTSTTSTPLSNSNVNTPGDISNQFGTITYSKGSSVIRMIENVIGEENFRRSLSKMITDGSFKNIKPIDLYTALDKNHQFSIYGMNMEDIMKPWIEQPGYPLLQVNVDRIARRIDLTQQRFLKSGESSDFLYTIPISYTSKNAIEYKNKTPDFIMRNRTAHIDDVMIDDWVIFNIQQTGFYRVNYDDVTWDFIIEMLNSNTSNKLHVYNKAQIIDDAFNMARENHMNYIRLFDIIQFLENEVHYNTWSAGFSGFSFMRLHFGKNEKISKLLDQHILTLMIKVIDDLGFDDDDSETNLRRLFRMSALTYACNLGHEKCIEYSKTAFRQMKADSSFKVKPNLREHVYCNGIRHGDMSDFNFLLNKHDSENVVSEQVIILGAMGCAKIPSLIETYLMKTFDVLSTIRDHDRMTAINSALNGNPENPAVVYEFFKKNVKKFKQIFGTSRLTTIISNLSARLKIDELIKFEEFITNTSELDSDEKKSAKNSIENARKNIEWTTSKHTDLITWLEAKYDNSTTSIFASFTLVIIMLFMQTVRELL